MLYHNESLPLTINLSNLFIRQRYVPQSINNVVIWCCHCLLQFCLRDVILFYKITSKPHILDFSNFYVLYIFDEFYKVL